MHVTLQDPTFNIPPPTATDRAFDFLGHHTFLVSPIFGITLVAIVYLINRNIRRAREQRYAASLAMNQPVEPVRPLPWTRGLLTGAGLAAFYLLVFRVLTLVPPFSRMDKGGTILMSFSFLFLGPFIAGVLTVAQGTGKQPWPVKAWILAPWIPVLANVILALSFAWEGIICVVFIVPPALLSASLGGVLAGALQRHWHRQPSRSTLYGIAVVPLLLAIVETHLTQPLQTRTVHTAISIHAPAPIVWQNIERVPAIARTELRSSWANAIGFPRPVEATLSHEGVGGVRNASFERGLTFTETVTDWQPLQRLAFTIRANTESIPPTTLDEHVTVGGRFFDVLTGEYRIEPLPNGDTLLHLSSQERLSTDFNAYAALWSDAVMRDMQGNILHVIQHRCEQQAQAAQRAAIN